MDDIEEMIRERYPKTDKERKCLPHRQRMEALREAYRQRLQGGFVTEGKVNSNEGEETFTPINEQESIHTEASKKNSAP